MESEKKQAAGEKLIRKSCAWLDSRNAKAGLSGDAKKAAQDRQIKAENALAEATEKYQKEN